MSQHRRVTRSAEQVERIRHARQVLAGNDVRPSPDPWVAQRGGLPFTALQRNALLLMLALLIISGLLLYLNLTLIASIPLLLLALLLIVSRFLF